MNLQQLLEQFLNLSMQQHVIKDQTIEGLRKDLAERDKRIAELLAELASRPTGN